MTEVHARVVQDHVARVGELHVELRQAAAAGHDAHRRPEPAELPAEPERNRTAGSRPVTRTRRP